MINKRLKYWFNFYRIQYVFEHVLFNNEYLNFKALYKYIKYIRTYFIKFITYQ